MGVICYTEWLIPSNLPFSNVRTHPSKNSSFAQILKKWIFSKIPIFMKPTNRNLDEFLRGTHTWKFFQIFFRCLRNILCIYHNGLWGKLQSIFWFEIRRNFTCFKVPNDGQLEICPKCHFSLFVIINDDMKYNRWRMIVKNFKEHLVPLTCYIRIIIVIGCWKSKIHFIENSRDLKNYIFSHLGSSPRI